MLDKKLVIAELNNIFSLIRASVDPLYLIELIATKKFGDTDIEASRKAWNKGIQYLMAEHNKEHKDKPPIEISKTFDFFGYVYNKLKRQGENQAEAHEGASWVLHFCFIPSALARLKPKMHETEDDETLYFDQNIRNKSKNKCT